MDCPFKEQRFVVVGSKGSLVFSDTEEINKLIYQNIHLRRRKIEKHTSKNIKIPS